MSEELIKDIYTMLLYRVLLINIGVILWIYMK